MAGFGPARCPRKRLPCSHKKSWPAKLNSRVTARNAMIYCTERGNNAGPEIQAIKEKWNTRGRTSTIQQIRRFLIFSLSRYSGYSVVPDEIREIDPSGRAGCDGATIPEDGGPAKYMAEKSVRMETHEPGFQIYPSSACCECRCRVVLATLLRKRL